MKQKVTESQAPIGVALFGMDERSTTRMATIFNMVYKGRCEHVQGKDAMLGIVDLDNNANAWDAFRKQHPDLPAIVMSENQNKIPDTTFVAKPAKLDDLWDSIFSLVTGLPRVSDINSKVDKSNVVSLAKNNDAAVTKKAAVSSAANLMNAKIDSTSTGRKSVKSSGLKDITDIYFNPDNYLLGRIVSSIKENAECECVIDVKCWRDQKLILVPDQNKAYTDLKDSQLKNLGVATFSDEFSVDVNIKQRRATENEIQGLRSISLDYLVWDLALRTSRGRIPEGTDESSIHYLKCWPNFPRLPSTPHGMRIASFWVKGPCKLDDIAMNLDISREDVNSFFSAAVMIGTAGGASRQVDSMVAPEKIQKKEKTKRGLLSSILRQISKKH